LGENIISTPATGLVGLRETVEDLVPDSFTNAFENIILVQMNWVESWNYVEQTNSKISKFKLNANSNVPAFIKKCVGLESHLKQNDKKISAIKAVGLGGIGATCLKMSQNNIGFDLSYDLSQEDEANIFKDVFYSFIIVTDEKTDEMLNLLKNYFAGLVVEVKKIGETKNEEIIFSQNTKIDFKKFQTKFFRNLEAMSL
jgi:phosphoribosylformylglycinamidine (FGAM) synthase-like enzyme